MTRQNITDDSSTPLLITKIMDGIKNFVTTEDAGVKPSEPTIQFCDEMPPDLGSYSRTILNFQINFQSQFLQITLTR